MEYKFHDDYYNSDDEEKFWDTRLTLLPDHTFTYMYHYQLNRDDMALYDTQVGFTGKYKIEDKTLFLSCEKDTSKKFQPKDFTAEIKGEFIDKKRVNLKDVPGVPDQYNSLAIK